MSTIDIGRLGEAKIIAHLVSEGYEVYSPLFGNTSCDLIVIKDGEVARVECKTTSKLNRYGTYTLMLRKTRHNRTKNTITSFDASKCEILACYIAPEDRIVLLNAKEYDGRSTINFQPLGG